MKNSSTLEILYKLKKEILKSDNDVLVSQIDHAIMKTYKDQLVFSFIGHYSAGKSSLINHMLNQDILPSSPVPTTSNTVSVQIGQSEEIQAFVDQYKYIPLESYGALRDLNTRDLDITSIAMDVRHPVFKERTVFQDTPGVDSSTSSHEESASRFLLNSDYIFFTVEYNHVESEHNLKLLKEISNLDIPFALVINQVDKHDDKELAMETFISRIRSTLGQWRIEPEHIFTTTIYDSPYNEITEMTHLISEIENARESYQAAYHARIIENIEDRQKQYIDEQLSGYYSRWPSAEDKTLEDVGRHISYLETEIKNDELARLHDDADALEEYVKNRSREIAKNSYLYPHSVKSAITDFLKVMSGDIQPGGLFGKKKKQAALFTDYRMAIGTSIEPVIKTEIDAPVNGLFGELGLTGSPFRYGWDESLLHEEEITTLSNTYILNYLDKLKRTMEKDISKQTVAHFRTLDAGNVQTMQSDDTPAAELKEYREIESLLRLKESVETTNYRHFYIHMDDELDKLNLTEPVHYDFGDTDMAEPPAEAQYQAEDETVIDIAPFRSVGTLLEGYPRHERFKNVFKDKLERIDDGLVNISVFGGFSAGKTTFINALMGESRLKTSPNPTTAAITEINDADESYAVYKREADLTDTLKVITNQDGESVGDYMPWMKRHRNSVTEAYMPFVNGVYHNYDAYKSNLGEKTPIPTDDLIYKISSDHDAIFIHKALLSIKNDLTERFTIVDSPGINSINQRHTKETHNIIANSDLIVYVSYYNHVFSRSDESFLKYIQSIKGKDFPIIFVINAVDLMQSESDKEKVVDYMAGSLRRLEIQNVIFPLSSKRALETGDAGFNDAKTGIVTLAEKNAAKIQLASLKETRAQLEAALESNIRRYNNQQEELAHIEKTREAVMEKLEAFTAMDVVPLLDQEIDIIHSHMDRQLELKLYDHLKGLVTVSDIGDRRYMSKNAAFLRSNINQFLSIEAATGFNAIYRKADDELEQIIRQFNERLKEANTAEALDNPAVDEEQLELSIDPQVLIQYQKPLNQARNNTKAFRDQLLTLSSELVKSINHDEVKQQMENMVRSYMALKDDSAADRIEQLMASLKEPLPEISETDYREDKALLEAMNNMEEVEA
ncbi:dynamin family protein [Salinicoccus sp. HZC-1]|uniref:dynamin family protein n=1 Tax=Salinicoccus sp. HZC-1 TaxID=3385497 RepID=UPI00398ABF7A